MPTDIVTPNWIITIGGETERRLQLTLKALNQLKQIEVTNTLECAGNGRAFFKPRVPGISWEHGAVGNAVFRGPLLRDILTLAGIRKQAGHVAFVGIGGRPDSQQQFVRSIPLRKALDANTIMATSMNGLPLTRDHGFPVRVLVPGWIGAASVKRVGEIRLLAHEAHGMFMQDAYRLPIDAPVPTTRQSTVSAALAGLPVKSMISGISGKRSVLQTLTVSGAAWAGESAISKVEVSTDSGGSWYPATLQGSNAKYAWTFWHYLWTPERRGQFRISVRATDTVGHRQPEMPKWNPRGYLWNGIDHALVTID